MAADKIVFDYSAMERRPGDTIRAEDWNAAMRAIAQLAQAIAGATASPAAPLTSAKGISMSADKIVFDYHAMERRPGDTIRAEDWNAAMRAIAQLAQAFAGAAAPPTVPPVVPPTPNPGTEAPHGGTQPTGRLPPFAASPTLVALQPYGGPEYGDEDFVIGIAVDATSAYVSVEGSLLAFDQPVLLTPAAQPRARTPCQAHGKVFLAGGYAYVAGQRGFSIVSVGDYHTPFETSYVPVGAPVRHIAVAGEFAYVVSWEAGLRIFNLADKSAPLLLSSIHVDTPNAVAVRDHYAFIASEHRGLIAMDVANVSAPFETGLPTQEFSPGKNICLYNHLAYLAGEPYGINIFDITQPDRPPLSAGRFSQGYYFSALRMIAQDDYLVVTTSDSFGMSTGMVIYDLSTPTAPVPVATVGRAANDIAVGPRYAYLCTPDGNLEIYDLRPPLPAPVPVPPPTPTGASPGSGGGVGLDPEPWQGATVSSLLLTARTVEFFKDRDGVVHLRGEVYMNVQEYGARGGRVGNEPEVFTLPSGYRPEFREQILVRDNGSQVDVLPDGRVVLVTYPNMMHVSLDGITFRAA